MNINEAFPSKWLRATDLKGPTLATIRKVTVENVGSEDNGGEEQKLVVFFQETDKGLVCNKTNANGIALILRTPETDDWVGKQVGLRVENVTFKGQMVPALRVFDPQPASTGGFAKGNKAAQEDDIPWGKDLGKDQIPDPDFPPITGQKRKPY